MKDYNGLRGERIIVWSSRHLRIDRIARIGETGMFYRMFTLLQVRFVTAQAAYQRACGYKPHLR